MADTIEIESQNLNYNQLVFRHIDRIQTMLTSSGSREDIIFRYSLGVQALISMIPETLRNGKKNDSKDETKSFQDKLDDINTKRDTILKSKTYNAREDYKLIQELFSLSINLFATKGYLYKKYSTGMPSGL